MILAGASSSLHDGQLRRSLAAKKLFEQLLSTADAAAASTSNSHGEGKPLPLHVALWQNAPVEVVRALLEKRPEWAQATETRSPWLPLHIALQSRAAPAVIRALLAAYPQAAHTTAAYGCLPLHVAARRGAAAEVVEDLLAANPAALEALADSGDAPTAIARKYGQHEAARALQAAEQRAADARAEAQRAADKQSWEAAERAQQSQLERAVHQRIEEQRLARELLDASQQQAASVSNDAMVEAARLTDAKLKEEIAAKEKLEKELFDERKERERLQAELDAAANKPPPENPADWKKHASKSGRPFWYNKKTKKSVWKDPTGGALP